MYIVIRDDKHDIANRRNMLCGQINDVLCYFSKCQPVVKQKRLYAYCHSLYGSVLWPLDLNNKHIDLSGNSLSRQL